MMKKLLFLLLVFTAIMIQVKAQDDEESPKGFKKENLFTGGSVTVSFFNGQTILGANPIFGYKINNYIDAGLAINYVYSEYRDPYNAYKTKQTVWGPGVFTRIYPIPFLFVQGQAEQNFSSYKLVPPTGSSSETEKYKADATSLLLGGGLATGRQKGGTTFFYISVLFDVLKDANSPYVNVTTNPNNGQQIVDIVPIIRAGVDVGLFQGRYK